LNISLYGVFLTSNAKNKEEATVKYFTTGVILTAIFLFTMSLYAVEFLTFDINTLNYLFLKNYTISENFNFNLNILQKLFYTIIIFLFLFKLGAYPFHFYLVDIYEILEPRKSMFYYTIPLKITVLLTLTNFLEYF
jgi:NADH-quinone oxidoreductase subunit N